MLNCKSHVSWPVDLANACGDRHPELASGEVTRRLPHLIEGGENGIARAETATDQTGRCARDSLRLRRKSPTAHMTARALGSTGAPLHAVLNLERNKR